MAQNRAVEYSQNYVAGLEKAARLHFVCRRCLTATEQSYIVRAKQEQEPKVRVKRAGRMPALHRARRTDGVTCTDTGTEGCAAATR